MAQNKNKKYRKAKVIDLFCGIGGMTHGFVREGFKVVAGIDIDQSCKYGFEKNNSSRFLHKDISKVTAKEINELYGKGKQFAKVLIGCAPCQPFSSLTNKNPYFKGSNDKEWKPLNKFIELIRKVKPHVVSMENVKQLADEKRFSIFKKFVGSLEKMGYNVSHEIVDCWRYGVPQRRRRLVLLASRIGDIKLIPKTHYKSNIRTVRKVLGHLPPINDGTTDARDKLHRSSKLSKLNKKRIIATPQDGGSAKSWDDDLVLKCHNKKKGKSYQCSVYGRMHWDEPSPTITTQSVSLGTGRFGHPEQDRAISLREAALLQTFPKYYKFVEPDKLSMKCVAKYIGNAVPVRLGQIIARSIKKHIDTCGDSVRLSA